MFNYTIDLQVYNCLCNRKDGQPIDAKKFSSAAKNLGGSAGAG